MRAIFANYSSSIDQLGSEFDRDDRTEHDRATGCDVLKQAKQWTGDARDMAIAMGTQLLGPDDVDELRIVLEGSECTGLGRWLVRQRLNQMATVAAQQILDADQRRFDTFVSDCLSELKNNGLNAVIESEDVVQIGSKSFSLTHIYESYRETGSFEDALNNILGRIRKN